MDFRILILASAVLMANCTSTGRTENAAKTYGHDIGDILFDSHLDDVDFQLCDSINISTSRRGLIYSGGNGSVKNACIQNFEYNPSFESFSGFVTIRFIVNCKLQSDRFRAQSMDFDFSEKECPIELQKHLLQIVSELEEWRPSSPKHASLDHAKYLNFKIENGRIKNVLQ